MKAAVVTEPDAVPRYADFADPEVPPGHELVELVAAAIHPVVRAKASGAHYSSTDEYPLVPGVDAVARTAAGTLVYTGGVREPWGTFAERISAPSTVMAPLPEGADPVATAAAMNPGMSSWLPLAAHRRTRGVPGTVLILGPTGMAGGLAVQNARAVGAERVVGVGRGAAALERVAALGADVVELTGDTTQDAQAIAAALRGSAPALVLDFVWGAAAEAAFVALSTVRDADATDYVEIGSVGGEHARVPAALLRSRRFRLSGSGIGSFGMREYLTEARTYLEHIASGRLTVAAAQYPLARVHDAWQAGPGPRPVVTA